MTTKNNNNGYARSGVNALQRNSRLKPGLSSRRPDGIDAAIGKKMRAMYDDLLHQPIPDRLVELLKQIDQAQETKAR